MNLAVTHLSTHTLLGLAERGVGLTMNSNSKGMPWRFGVVECSKDSTALPFREWLKSWRTV